MEHVHELGEADLGTVAGGNDDDAELRRQRMEEQATTLLSQNPVSYTL
jgi:hypothetical protein